MFHLKIKNLFFVYSLLAILLFISACSQKKSAEKSVNGEKICVDAGPQSPRDIDNKMGENELTFPVAPSYKEMNLCNIHFHYNAEHKSKDYPIYAGDGENGLGGGYQCADSKNLTQSELKFLEGDYSAGLKPGDTIEVHWVYSTCDVKPGKGLGSCLSDTCNEPLLRVEAQVFLLVNDPLAANFRDYSYNFDNPTEKGYYQAKSLPTNTGKPVVYLGSTTGPKYNNRECSPLQVTWSVRPKCAKLDINSLSEWLKENVFEEEKAHGVRKLVVHPKLLSEIK